MNRTQQIGLIVIGVCLVIVITALSIWVGQEEVKTTAILTPEKSQDVASSPDVSNVAVVEHASFEPVPSETPQAAELQKADVQEAAEPEYEGVVRGPLMQ